MINEHNKVTIQGVVTKEPSASHEVYGETFYELILSVNRLSQTVDFVPITISERLIDMNKIEVGKTIKVIGQLRSYNKLIDGKSKLILSVFTKEVECVDPSLPHMNSIELTGYICKTPIYRTTPFMREICDVLVAVNRAYTKSDYIPVIAWGRNARFVSNLGISHQINITGRIQSRIYQKRTETGECQERIAYEVSANKISNIIPELNQTMTVDNNQSKNLEKSEKEISYKKPSIVVNM